MIKNIEDLKKYNIICTTTKEVEECLNMLNTEEQNRDIINDDYQRIVYYSKYSNKYILSPGAQLDNDISFYHFKKVYNRLKKREKEKEKQADFEVDENGRILKINNKGSKKEIFIACDYGLIKECMEIKDIAQSFLDFILKYGFAYATEEARDRAMFKLEIETKLKNIAERLNAGRKIDWEDIDQNKYEIYYDYIRKKIECRAFCYCKDQGAIYCLDKNFLEVAKQEIGEEDLKRYFLQSY